jgi:hypothetical protein
MEVLIDQTRKYDLGLEGVVHGELDVAEGGLHFVEGAHGQDALTGHGHGGGFQVAALHGQDFLRRIDRHHFGRRRGGKFPGSITLSRRRAGAHKQPGRDQAGGH